jgi:hypothetical protein
MAREFTLEVWLLTRSIHGVVLYSGARQNRSLRYQLIPAPRDTVQHIIIYGPMIYTSPYVMLLMRADSLPWQVGGAWALEIETLLDPVKCYRAVR